MNKSLCLTTCHTCTPRCVVAIKSWGWRNKNVTVERAEVSHPGISGPLALKATIICRVNHRAARTPCPTSVVLVLTQAWMGSHILVLGLLFQSVVLHRHAPWFLHESLLLLLLLFLLLLLLLLFLVFMSLSPSSHHVQILKVNSRFQKHVCNLLF